MLTADELKGLGIALNEAVLLGIEVDEGRQIAAISLEVLSLPRGNAQPLPDGRVQILLSPIGRIIASLREGNWNDESAAVLPVTVEGLLDLTMQMRSAIYGWEFFDLPEESFSDWSDRLSLEADYGLDGREHSIYLFQEYGPHQFIGHFDIRIWFDEIEIRDAAGTTISVADFIAGGRRWWDGFYDGDPRTRKTGGGRSIVSLRGSD